MKVNEIGVHVWRCIPRRGSRRRQSPLFAAAFRLPASTSTSREPSWSSRAVSSRRLFLLSYSSSSRALDAGRATCGCAVSRRLYWWWQRRSLSLNDGTDDVFRKAIQVPYSTWKKRVFRSISVCSHSVKFWAATSTSSSLCQIHYVLVWHVIQAVTEENSDPSWPRTILPIPSLLSSFRGKKGFPWNSMGYGQYDPMYTRQRSLILLFTTRAKVALFV